MPDCGVLPEFRSVAQPGTGEATVLTKTGHSRFGNLQLRIVIFISFCAGSPDTASVPYRPLILFISLTLIGCGAVSHTPQTLFTDTSQSPDTGCHQGYATDGVSHFLFDTHRILKRADDTTWHISGVNDTPFAGLTGFDHIGDGDYFEGKLYAPVEQYLSCTSDSNPAIFVFDTATLVRERVIDLPVAAEVSGVAVRPETRELFVSSYCDGTRLWIYDVDTFVLKGSIVLRPALHDVQGLAYRDGFFFVAQNDGLLMRVSPDGQTQQVFKTDSPGAHEGLDYSQTELRWLIDEGLGEQKVHYLVRR